MKIKYKPHTNQQTIHKAAEKYRYLVVCAGRRFGKSVFARHHCLLNAVYNPGLYWIVTPTYRQGKQIHWHELKKEIPRELISYKNEQELSIELINGSRIEIKGADNEDALRGVGLKGVVIDEAADQKPHVWQEIIRPTLLDSKGWAIFIGTPKGFNWFYQLWLKGKKGTREHDSDWKSFQFSSYDNPTLPGGKAEIDKAKKGSDEDVFAQEYLAEFKKFKGLIYKEFDRDIHVIEPFDFSEQDGWELYRSVDFGYDNPTVCLWIAVSPDNKWYVIDEYYETQQASDYHCGIILSKSAQYTTATMTFGDPSGVQVMKDWAQRGVYITPARRDSGTNKGDWVGHGIDLITEKLKVSVMDKKPQLFIVNNCKNIIREFEAYEWEEPKDELINNPGRPKKANDHALDALRYFTVSYRGRQQTYFPEDNKDWSFT
jgi:hypothetical protein